jgi:hypothetical protein
MRLLICLVLLMFPATAWAEACGPRLVVAFTEGAPKDRFTLTNASDPGWGVTSVEIDLGPSRGRLIFDTTERGAGESVYQPYEEAGGSATVSGRSQVTDGDTVIALQFASFAPGALSAFTIDLDDTVSGSPTIVSDAEILGGRVQANFVKSDGQSAAKTAIFDDTSEADTGKLENCFVS